MQRFLVLCLATLFLVYEPISSSSSIPTTTAAPTNNVSTTTLAATTTKVLTTTAAPTTTVNMTTTAPSTTVNATTTAPNATVNATTTATNATVNATTTAPNATVLTATASKTTAPTTSITPTATPTSTPPKSISVVATFDITFKEGYKDKSSVDYKYLEGNLTKVLNETFHEMPGYLRVEILSFRSGSVICDFKVIFETTANPSAENVKQTLQKASDGGKLGEYTVTNIEVVATTTTTPTTSSSDKIWDKVIFDYLGGTLISFIVMVAAVGLCLILLIALICTCVRYRKLKKKTQFPKDLIINNDSAWINSHDNLLMWERNLRATEVNPAANAQNRPTNEKRA